MVNRLQTRAPKRMVRNGGGRTPRTTKTSGNGKADKKKIEIPALRKKLMTVRINGLSRLVVHKFSTKSKREMEEKTQGRARHKKPPRNPKKEYEEALYRIGERKYGIPAAAFKEAAVKACTSVHGVSQTQARQAFHVMGDLVELKKHTGPFMREDIVRIGRWPNKIAQVRYRPEFPEWRVELKILYNENVLTEAQIIDLLNNAGFAVGVCEGRPEKCSLGWGLFEVAAG